MPDHISHCRICKGAKLQTILAYGKTPIADQPRSCLGQEMATEELTLQFCRSCSCVQIRETLQPSRLFNHTYPYFSSTSPALCRHFEKSFSQLNKTLSPGATVIELACNDGCMTQHFVKEGHRVIGIEPSPKQAGLARKKGAYVINDFFGQRVAQELCKDGVKADLILANNVLAHVDKLHEFVEGAFRVLKEKGKMVIEVPYVADLIEKLEFDTVYHQHLCYFSLHSLKALFEKHALYLNDVEKISIHGGSLRVSISKSNTYSKSVESLLFSERENGILEFPYYENFQRRVLAFKEDVLKLLNHYKQKGKIIAAYGAAAKACTFASFMGFDESCFSFITDLNSNKWGVIFDPLQLEVVSPGKILRDMPDALFNFSWNFSREITHQQEKYLQLGGEIITPLPSLQILSKRGEVSGKLSRMFC